MFDESKENRNAIKKIVYGGGKHEKRNQKMKSEIDRVEEFSIQDHLRMHGVPHSEAFEDYDTCARVVVDVLNNVDGLKK